MIKYYDGKCRSADRGCDDDDDIISLTGQGDVSGEPRGDVLCASVRRPQERAIIQVHVGKEPSC